MVTPRGIRRELRFHLFDLNYHRYRHWCGTTLAYIMDSLASLALSHTQNRPVNTKPSTNIHLTHFPLFFFNIFQPTLISIVSHFISLSLSFFFGSNKSIKICVASGPFPYSLLGKIVHFPI